MLQFFLVTVILYMLCSVSIIYKFICSEIKKAHNFTTSRSKASAIVA